MLLMELDLLLLEDMVTKPTMGLVGEAGEDEYIIPASKMAQSMQRYSAGARGESVIPGTGQSSAGGGADAQQPLTTLALY
jgi:hypothetical protein